MQRGREGATAVFANLLEPYQRWLEVGSNSLAGTRINQSDRRGEQATVQQLSQVISPIADWPPTRGMGGGAENARGMGEGTVTSNTERT